MTIRKTLSALLALVLLSPLLQPAATSAQVTTLTLPPGTYVAELPQFSQDRDLYGERTVEVYAHLTLVRARAQIVVGTDGQVDSGLISYRWEGTPRQPGLATSFELTTIAWDRTTARVLPLPASEGELRLQMQFTSTEIRSPCRDLPAGAAPCETPFIRTDQMLVRLVPHPSGGVILCGNAIIRGTTTRPTCPGAGDLITLTNTAPVLQECGAVSSAFDEIRLRALASQKSLELLRDYHAELAQKEIDLSESLFWDSVVDFGAIAAGWPLGAAIQEAILGKAALTFGESLIKAGFKSVNQKIAKDPSLGAAFDQLNTVTWPDESLLPEGAAVDLALEGVKAGITDAVGEVAGETAMGVLDVVKFGWSSYQGMKQQDAMRAMKNRVFDKIIALETQHAEQQHIWERTQFALEICEFREKNHLPSEQLPDWAEISAYLGIA